MFVHVMFVPSKSILDGFPSTDCLNTFLAKFQNNKKQLLAKFVYH